MTYTFLRNKIGFSSMIKIVILLKTSTVSKKQGLIKASRKGMRINYRPISRRRSGRAEGATRPYSANVRNEAECEPALLSSLALL